MFKKRTSFYKKTRYHPPKVRDKKIKLLLSNSRRDYLQRFEGLLLAEEVP